MTVADLLKSKSALTNATALTILKSSISNLVTDKIEVQSEDASVILEEGSLCIEEESDIELAEELADSIEITNEEDYIDGVYQV